jgi:nicotinamide-nucleotide amidase
MKAIFISIGDELLIGQTVNTNAAWLGQECSRRGIRVERVVAISDDEDEIKTELNASIENADLVLITGGLGPTKDDLTKHTLVDYFETKLVRHEPTLRQIESFFTARNRPMLEANTQQADLPESCTILPNPNGTAAGMWFEKNGTIVVSMPGVPYEMKAIMLDEVFPSLEEKFQLQSLYHRTIMTQGIGESFLAEKIKSWEDHVRASGLGLAYLPSPGQVKLRLTSREGKSRAAEIDSLFDQLENNLPRYCYGRDEVTLKEVIGSILRQSGKTLGTVESCTGGGLAAEITSVFGASAYFEGALTTYSNQQKHALLGIPMEDLHHYGAVSREIAKAMAVHGLEQLGVDWCVSTTGVAGPTGGTEETPIGTIFIGVASEKEVNVWSFRFGDNRERNIQMTILSALNALRCSMLGLTSD